jgi:hypothetical protein
MGGTFIVRPDPWGVGAGNRPGLPDTAEDA